MSEVKLRYGDESIEVGNVHRGRYKEVDCIIAEDMSNGDLYLKIGDEKWIYMEWSRMWNEAEKRFEIDKGVVECTS